MKTNYYRQCKLQRNNTFLVSYIPEEYAIVGNTLKLKNNEIWENGWRVISAGDKINSKYVEENERNYLRQRKASDI